MALLQAIRHHIRRAHVKAGVRNDWAADYEAECQAEDEALEQRLELLERQVRNLQDRLLPTKLHVQRAGETLADYHDRLDVEGSKR